MINIYTTSRYSIKKKPFVAFTQDLLSKKALDGYTVNIILIGRRKMRSVALEYGHGDVAKPVLSFTFKEKLDESGEPLLGEIYICYPQAVLLAAERNKSVDTTLEYLIEHGINNLITYE